MVDNRRQSILYKIFKDKKFRQNFLLYILGIYAGVITLFIFFNLDKEYILLFLTGIGWITGQLILKNKEIEQKHFEKKALAYQNFISEFMNGAIQYKGKERDKKLFKAMMDFKKTVLVWGKPEMIKDMLRLQEKLLSVAELPSNVVEASDFLYRIIRKDLGHDDSTLKHYELAQLTLTDNIDDILEGRLK